MRTVSPLPGFVSPGAGLPALIHGGAPVVGQFVFIPAKPSERRIVCASHRPDGTSLDGHPRGLLMWCEPCQCWVFFTHKRALYTCRCCATSFRRLRADMIAADEVGS